MTFKARAAQWLREPLVHFLLIGALVFALMSGRPADPGERRIVVDQAVVARIVEQFSLSFRRVPSQTEIDGLIRDYVKDEIYYREALRLGLDRDDEVVRKRLRSKMIAAATGEAEAVTPSNAELQALLDKDPARYALEVQYDFTQVYLGDDRPEVRAIAGAALKRLQVGGKFDIERRLPLPRSFTQASGGDIAAQFGEGFAVQLKGIPIGEWSGPVASGLGLHLVRIERRAVPTKPKLADVRQRLENDWHAAALRAAEDKDYRDLLQGYDVIIAVPK